MFRPSRQVQAVCTSRSGRWPTSDAMWSCVLQISGRTADADISEAEPARIFLQANNFTFHYAFYVVMNWLPTYFDSVLHAGLATAGSAKMLPYIVMFAMSNVGGYAGDWLIEHRFSVAHARKIVNTVGAQPLQFMYLMTCSVQHLKCSTS